MESVASASLAASLDIAKNGRRGKPARNGEVENHVPRARLVVVVEVDTVLGVEFDGFSWSELLGDTAEAESGVVRLAREEFGLTLESDDE